MRTAMVLSIAWAAMAAVGVSAEGISFSEATILTSGKGAFTSLAFSSDGSTLVAVERRTTVADNLLSRFRGEFHIFDLADGGVTERPIPAKVENYTRVVQADGPLDSLLSDDDMLAVVGPDPVWKGSAADARRLDVRIETVKSQQTLATIPYHEEGASWGLAVCPNRKLFALCDGGGMDGDEEKPFGRVEIWDLESGKSVFQHKSDEVDIHAIAFSHDGERFATGGGFAHYSAFLRDLQHKYGSYQDGAATIYDASSGTALHTLPRLESVDGNPHRLVESLAFSPDDRFLVTGERSGTITWWDVSTGEKIRSAHMARPFRRRTEQLGYARVLSMAYASTGRYLFVAVGSYDRGGRWGELRVLDDETGEVLDVLVERDAVNERYEYVVELLAISNDGQTLAAATSDGTIRQWTIGADGR